MLGTPLLEKLDWFLGSWFLGSWFLGFLVSRFLVVWLRVIGCWFIGFLVSWFLGFLVPKFQSSNKNLLDGPPGLFGARLFQSFQNMAFLTFEMYKTKIMVGNDLGFSSII